MKKKNSILGNDGCQNCVTLSDEPQKPGRKHSDLEREERILYLLELRSKGVKATSDLFRFFSDKYPNLTKRMFEYDLAEVKEKIAEYFEKDADFEIAEISKHLWELYSKSLKLQDYRECRAILKEIRELKSLSVKKVEHSGEIQIPAFAWGDVAK